MVTVEGHLATFRFFRPQAQQVSLTGDFNSWIVGRQAMIRDAEGYWTARLRLPKGQFRFRYCADGQWFADYAACGLEIGPFGVDSLVRIDAVSKPPPTRARRKVNKSSRRVAALAAGQNA